MSVVGSKMLLPMLRSTERRNRHTAVASHNVVCDCNVFGEKSPPKGSGDDVDNIVNTFVTIMQFIMIGLN